MAPPSSGTEFNNGYATSNAQSDADCGTRRNPCRGDLEHPAAEAIIIVNSQTGAFTLTARDAVRIYVANTVEEAGIMIVNSIFDSDGNLLHTARHRSACRSAARDSSSTHPTCQTVGARRRAVLTIEGAGGGKTPGFIPSFEVFDRETGRTCWFVDFIIDDGDMPVR